jgi:hypothetical protein
MNLKATKWAVPAAVLLAGTAMAGAFPASAAPIPHAASNTTTVLPGSITLSPTSISAKKNTAVSLKVTVNTGGRPVNAVQITLSFADSRLDCASLTPGSAWSAVAVKTCNSSTAQIVVFTPGGTPAFTGTAVAATVGLKTTSVTGKAVITLPLVSNLAVTSDTNTDIVGTTNSATVTVS